MTSTSAAQFHEGLERVSPEDWRIVAGDDRLDRSHAYLSFREHVEPGRPIVLTLDDAEGPAVAFHGALTTPSTAMFSHPWKMLTNPQFLRLDERAGEEDAVRTEHRALIDAVCGTATAGSSQEAPHLKLSEALGEALVIRGIDNSEVIRRGGLTPDARLRATTALVSEAQDLVRDGLAGAIVLPFVDPDDEELRHVLGRQGFRYAALTAVSSFPLSGFDSYDALLASLRHNRRFLFRREQRALEKAGLHLEAVSPDDATLDRVTELEIANARKYGGAPRHDALLATRRVMADQLAHALRVTAVRQADGTIIACGLHLVDRHTYCALVYGCDYDIPERSTAYQCVNFYDPLRHALNHGIQQFRVGFEAFTPKLVRGARLAPRETWLWAPDQRRLEALDHLLRHLGDPCAKYFADLASQHRSIA